MNAEGSQTTSKWSLGGNRRLTGRETDWQLSESEQSAEDVRNQYDCISTFRRMKFRVISAK